MAEKVKILNVSSFSYKPNMVELMAANLDRSKYEYHCALMNPRDSFLEDYLKEIDIPVYRIQYAGKRDGLRAIAKLAKLIWTIQPHVVHARLVDATYTAIPLAWLMGVKRRVFTRHHSDLHHKYHPHAIKYDIAINALATDIIVPGKVAYEIVVDWEKADPTKVSLVNDPFDLPYYINPPAEDVEYVLDKYNPKKKRPVIGVISRWIEWKGVHYIIPAMKRLVKEYPDMLLVLANARGPQKAELEEMLKDFPKENLCVIDFENRNAALYRLFDVFVHTPVDPHAENTGGVYVEAMAACVPSVVTHSGWAPEFIHHMDNGYVVDFRNSEQIYEGVKTLLENPALAQQFRERASRDVGDRFSIHSHIRKMESIYTTSIREY